MTAPKASKTIIKGVSLLRHLAGGTNTVTDVASARDLSKATTHRLLKSLETSRLAVQDPITRQYFLGPLIFELASSSLAAHQALIMCASEDMAALRELSGETVALYIRIGLERICVEEVPSRATIRFTVGKGGVFPLYVGSSGKVLLSELADPDLNLLVSHLHLAPVGPETITNRGVFLKEVKKTRKQGYATSFSERVPGGASICVPIHNYVCPVALSVLGPDNRFTREAMMRLLGSIKAGAARISRKLASVR